ncbi:neural cell adhesion molecule L1.1-like isoform X2 [Denticeps clupeoides]|uniref:neural cell adhesion molecule L1.1-like isoform X2 n=1 Tax=Denticeps clupeoides TaxID=299321 RepID=UPI0010A3061B|nr:neural cell adhesion molecule L1.1-like isoform X2 [Denticeps clupeoides]
MPEAQFKQQSSRGKQCWLHQHPLLVLLLFYTSGPTQGSINIPLQYAKRDLIKQPPVIVTQPESMTAFNPDDFILSCEASGSPPPSYRWEKDGTQFGKLEDPLIQILNSTNQPDVLNSYQGQYRCYASNELGTAVSNLVTVITEKTPTLPKGKRESHQKEEGEHAVLHCNPPASSKPPTIYWMDKRLMHITQSDRVITGLDGNLYFANVISKDSRDDYICHAQYMEARTILPKDPIRLTVNPTNSLMKNRKPHLHKPSGSQSSYVALKNRSIILECIPWGLPTPTVEWRLKGSNRVITQANVQKYGRWLEFDNISESDDGEYECIASNAFGEVKHTYTLTVEAAPTWTKEPKSLLYARGETVKLDCQAEGIPTPVVTWTMNGHSELNDPGLTLQGGALILTNVQYSDTAVYQCEAVNKHGRILANAYVYVIELPPQILTEDYKIYRVVEGKRGHLECSSFGSPRPTIEWLDENLEPAQANARMYQLTDGALQITNASREDSGRYTCSVHNSNQSISAQLDVLNRTTIVSPPKDIRAIRGQPATLTCSARIDERLAKADLIHWRKNGDNIEESPIDDKYTITEDGSLIITDISSSDTGSYTCEVITDLDVEKATGSLTVVDKPGPPSDVMLSGKTDRSITLSWTPANENNSPVFEYIIEMLEERHSDILTWEVVKRVGADVTQVEVRLRPYGKYHFQVFAVNEIGKSEPSKYTEILETPPAAPDHYPKHVKSLPADPDTLVISWEEMDLRDYNGPDFKYRVFWRQSGDKGHHWQDSVVDGPPFVVKGAGTFTPFEIKVQAVNKIGQGPDSSPKIGHSGEDFPLDAPSDVSVEVNGTAVVVRWSPVRLESVRGHLQGYKIHLKGPRKLRGHRRPDVNIESESEENEVKTVHGNRNKEVMRGLQFFSEYSLKVTAFNNKGESPHSKTHDFSTPEGVPGPPVFLDFESPSETELVLHWRAPEKPNGHLTGYQIQYSEIVEEGASEIKIEDIKDPTATFFHLKNLNPDSQYHFYLRGRTIAGYGEQITQRGATLLDGVPPSNVSMVSGMTYLNLSWVPNERHRNTLFNFHYLMKSAGGEWTISDDVNTSQRFYQIQGLKTGTQYRLRILLNNNTSWEDEAKTSGPELFAVGTGFATEGWFIGLISAIVLLLLVLLILCFIKRGKGVKGKEEHQVDSEARPMKDETFGEYRSLESDNEEKRSGSQPSLCVESKMGSDDSLAGYADSVDIQYNEDGSFIGQYSGHRGGPAHGGQGSSGPTSPINPTMPPSSISFNNSVTGILDQVI